MVPSVITRPFTRFSGAPLRNHPFGAHYTEVHRIRGVDIPLAEGAIFRDAEGRQRTDVRTPSSAGSLNLTRIIDPDSSSVVLINHADQSYVKMAAEFERDADRHWVSGLTSCRIPDDRLESFGTHKTIEGLDCVLLVLDPRTSYEVWVSHLLGHAVREQVRDDDGLRLWALRDVKIGDVDQTVFRIPPAYSTRD